MLVHLTRVSGFHSPPFSRPSIRWNKLSLRFCRDHALLDKIFFNSFDKELFLWYVQFAKLWNYICSIFYRIQYTPNNFYKLTQQSKAGFFYEIISGEAEIL